MSRYFFDTDDGDLLLRDVNGLIARDDAQARRYALQVLGEMMRDHIGGGGRRVLVAAVRNQSGDVIYRATLKLKGEWVQGNVG